MDAGWIGGPAIAAVGIGVSFYFSKRGSSEDKEAKIVAKAKELQAIQSDLSWLKSQFGPTPNGGGIMERINNHITRQDAHNQRNDEKLEALTIGQAEQKLLLSEHFKYHEG